MNNIIRYSREDTAAFENAVREFLAAQQGDEAKKQKKQLVKLHRRVAELEILIRKIYEDNALGKLSDKRYDVLSVEYENEQTALELQISGLQAAVTEYKSNAECAARFIELVKRYQEISDISAEVLNAFVEKIVVYERERKGCTHTDQRIDICLNFVGVFTAPEEEIDDEARAVIADERRRRAVRQEQMHQHYLARRAANAAKTQ